MGFLDKVKGKATEMVDKHGEQIADGMDKAAGVVDKRTKGKYSDKIRTGNQKAKDALDKLDDKNDDIN